MALLQKSRAKAGTLTSKVQEAVYNKDPDFGNRSLEEKGQVVRKVLSDWNLNFSLYSNEKQQQAVDTLLSSMGEESSYSVLEGVYDTVVPSLGAAAGGMAGALTAGAGAGIRAPPIVA